MLITTCGAGFIGTKGRIVSVQLHRMRGARFHVSGLSWTAARHALARIYAALETIHLPRPSGAMTLHIGPTNHSIVEGSLDLPIALAMLASSGEISSDKLTSLFSWGELTLEGKIQPGSPQSMPLHDGMEWFIPGSSARIQQCFIPLDSTPDVPQEIPVYYPGDLYQACDALQGKGSLPRVNLQPKHLPSRQAKSPLLYDSIEGELLSKQGIVISAAGRHHMLLIGAPGSGKSMMARALVELLPAATDTEFKQFKQLHARRGEPYSDKGLRPFRQPHNQATAHALIGSWNASGAVPGELALASGGVLCLDEFPEFSRNAIEALRSPLERGRVEIARADGSQTFNANGITVATANPCPCGHLTNRTRTCRCTRGEVRRYLRRISGPVMERFALHLETPSGQLRESAASTSGGRWWSMEGESAQKAIRNVWEERQKDPVFHWPEQVEELFKKSMAKWAFSHRASQSIRSVAETCALLDGAMTENTRGFWEISEADLILALQFRIFDRPSWLEHSFQNHWPEHHSTLH